MSAPDPGEARPMRPAANQATEADAADEATLPSADEAALRAAGDEATLRSAAERTRLAYRRTTLGITVAALVATALVLRGAGLRHQADTGTAPQLPVAVVLGLLALDWALVIAVTAPRVLALRSDRIDGRLAPATLAALVTAFAGLGAALVVLVRLD